MGFPPQLLDAFWHTTSLERFKLILSSGHIHPEPDIEGFRWGANRGPDYHPFVRTLGGISIFDFFGFNPEQYSQMFPASSWHNFVPTQQHSDQAIWIQLSPERLPGEFLDGSQLKLLQEERGAYKNNLMPRIECAHIGPIPIEYFVNVLQYDNAQGFTTYSATNT